MDINVFPVLTDDDLKMPFYVTSAGEWDNQEDIERKHGFPDFQWIQCLHGEGRLLLEEQSYSIGAGQGMLLFPNKRHHYYAALQPWSVRWVTFNGFAAEGLLSSLHFDRCQKLYLSDAELMLENLYKIRTKIGSNELFKSLECSSFLYELLLNLYKYSSATEVRFKHRDLDQMAPLFHYIEEHYHEVITLQQLAEQISVTPQHTCLLFQQNMGLRPFEYITKFRIRKAKELLLQKKAIPIANISQQVGYEHPSYFIKLFKLHEGVTPTMFRRNHR